MVEDYPVDSFDEKLGPFPFRLLDPEFFREPSPDFVIPDSVRFDVSVSLPMLGGVDLEEK